MPVLHVALEYTVRVGGLGAVTTGLIPELNEKGVETAVVTPFYTAYRQVYSDINCIATVKHIYKGKIQTTEVHVVTHTNAAGIEVKHYLLKPAAKDFNNRIFDIEDPLTIYHNFPHSQAHNRREYFNGAVAALVRTNIDIIPKFEIVHLHTWHVGLSGCLIKEFENLGGYKTLLSNGSTEANKCPRIFFTTHMLLEREHGYLRKPKEIQDLFASVGLPAGFENSFAGYREHIREDYLKMHALGLMYADYVSIVSKSVIEEIFNGVPHGLLDIFTKLRTQERLVGITNGITYADWDPTSEANLTEFTVDLEDVISSKQKIKEHLAPSRYSNLDPNKQWFLFVGRFANEKSIDLLPAALEAIRAAGGHLIVMGVHISKDRDNPVSRVIEFLHSQADVLVIDNPAEQKVVGMMVRVASEFTLIPSNNETCGIVPMEARTCASIPIASKVQGLPDTVIPFTAHFSVGTGYLFNYPPELREDYLKKDIDPNTLERIELREGLKQAISKASAEYKKLQLTGALNPLLARLVMQARELDWGAKPVASYVEAYKTVLTMPPLTCDQIHAAPPMPLLSQFAALSTKSKTAAVQPRVFIIGFNKCGTWSIHAFLEQYMKSVHYEGGHLASSMYINMLKGQPMIPDKYKDVVVFSDMENIYHGSGPVYIALYFKELDKQYPGSKFILNTRDREKWINSRCKHTDEVNGVSYAQELSKKYGLTEEQLKDKWRKEWDSHHANVMQYFAGRENDLLVFDIEKHGGEELAGFFKRELGMDLDPGLYRHLNKTLDATAPKLALV